MDWFPDILQGLQLTNRADILHILPTEGMPYFSENPNLQKRVAAVQRS